MNVVYLNHYKHLRIEITNQIYINKETDIMLKLKSLLGEGFAWERKDGKSLPTLAEVQAEYERNLKETEYKVSGRPVKLNKNGSEDQTKWTVTFTATGKTAQYSDVISLIKPRPEMEPRWQDNDGDGKWYEKGDDVKEIKEGYGDPTILDLVSDAMAILDRLHDDMATNSVLQREEKHGYLDAYNMVLGILADIRDQADGMDEEDDIRGWR